MAENEFVTPPGIRAKLGQLLLYLADDVLEAVDTTLEEYGISESKLSLLLLFVATNNKQQSLQPSEIAKRLGIRRAAVTKQLDWLEAHQLIFREINLQDQRMVNVTITEKGYRLLHQVMPPYWKTCADLTQPLCEEEVVLLFTLLRKIHRQKEGA